MPLFFEVFQVNPNSRGSNAGKWLGRVKILSEKTEDDLADAIAKRCTLTRSDILAVLSELQVEMSRELQAGNKVKLRYVGTFKLGMKTKGANAGKDFTVKGNIKGCHVLFQPITTMPVGADGTRYASRVMTEGVVYQQLGDPIPWTEPADEGA